MSVVRCLSACLSAGGTVAFYLLISHSTPPAFRFPSFGTLIMPSFNFKAIIIAVVLGSGVGVLIGVLIWLRVTQAGLSNDPE